VSTGFVVFAHGSRIESANEAVRAVAAQLAAAGPFDQVEAAFLELGRPDLDGAVTALAEHGARRIVVIPYFLTWGLHLERDLTRLVDQVAQAHHDLEVVMTPPLDGHPGLLAVLLDRARSMPPESDQAPTPRIIYKYTDRNGVEKILSNRTLRFARPSEMNDPFDIYIEDLLGLDLEEVHERAIDALCDLLTKNPQEYSDRCGVPLESAEASAKILRNASDERTDEIRRYLKSVDIAALSPEYNALRTEQPALRDAVVNHLRNCAIFCASGTPSNLLMWAHYAEQHRGAVLGFLPDVARDSMLTQIEPVAYSERRPSLLDDSNLLARPTPESAAAANRRLFLTKSSEWSYEQELRLFIPGEIQPGQNATFKHFYATELVEVYLGCRMSRENRGMVTELAKRLNAEARVFSVVLGRRKYALDMSRVA